MNRNLVKTKINGKTVELGLNTGVSSSKIEILGVSSEDATLEDIQNINEKIDKINANIPENVDIIDYIDELQGQSGPKPWWKSKTVWINVSALLMSVSAYFGINMNIDPELLMLIASIAIPAINIWLRNITTKPIR